MVTQPIQAPASAQLGGRCRKRSWTRAKRGYAWLSDALGASDSGSLKLLVEERFDLKVVIRRILLAEIMRGLR